MIATKIRETDSSGGANVTKFQITQHAVERFQERFPGNLSRERAAQQLRSHANSARRDGQRTSGERYYRSGLVLMVVKENRIVTVYAVNIPYAA